MNEASYCGVLSANPSILTKQIMQTLAMILLIAVLTSATLAAGALLALAYSTLGLGGALTAAAGMSALATAATLD